LSLQGSMTQNPIVNASWYDESGRQYSFPVNGQNTYNTSAWAMVNAPIAKSNFSISNNTNVSYSKTGNYVGAGRLNVDKYWENEEKTVFNYDRFLADYPDLDESEDFIANTTRNLSVSESIRLNWRSDNLELTANARTRFSKPWYTMTSSGIQDNITWNNSVGGSFNWTLWQNGLTATSDINYNWYVGYRTEQPSRLLWNATLQLPIIRNQATLSLTASDILGQRRNLNVSDTENYHQETRTNTLGRYVILSFTWRFGTFGGRNNRQRGGFGGPGGGPGGYGRGGFGGGRPF